MADVAIVLNRKSFAHDRVVGVVDPPADQFSAGVPPVKLSLVGRSRSVVKIMGRRGRHLTYVSGDIQLRSGARRSDASGNSARKRVP